MTTTLTTKQPYDAYAISFDFTLLLNGATISSAAMTAEVESTGADVTSTILDVAKQTETDSIVYGWVRAGSSGVDYVITCQIIASDTSQYELDAILPVLEDPSSGVASAGGTRCVTEPTLEPVTLAELQTQLGISSGTMATDVTPYTSLPSGSYPITYELMTLDVAPATAWAVGNLITGQTSTQTCTVVHVLTTKTFIVKSRSGAFTLGEIVGVTGTAGKLADQGPAFPTFVTTYNSGYMALGTAVDVLGRTAVVYLTPVNNGAGGTVDVKIQEADVLAGPYTDWSTGAFTQVTELNDTTIQEKAYTGSKQYIRTVAKTLVAACEFGTSVMVWEPNVSDDDMLTELIKSGRLSVENDTSKKIMQQTWDYCPKSWPSGDRLKIPFGNLSSVSSVTWKSTDGTVTTLVENTDYLVETNGEQCGFLVLPYQGSWPSGELYPSNAITVRFVCGYSTQAAVPVVFKQAVKKWCVNNYANRGDDVIGANTVKYDQTYGRLINLCGRLNDMDFDF